VLKRSGEESKMTDLVLLVLFQLRVELVHDRYGLHERFTPHTTEWGSVSPTPSFHFPKRFHTTAE
jgi:hypothetical protein